jgi:four helix bundle protein
MLFQELDVYKQGLQLAIDVHKLTETFPKGIGFGLGDQMRRAALSIPCNLSEGAMRNNPKEFIQFVGIARGSCAELRTLLAVAEGVGYLKETKDLAVRTERIRQMLTALLNSLRKKAVPK